MGKQLTEEQLQRRRESQRRYREANREKLREADRLKRRRQMQDPEKRARANQVARESRARNRSELLARRRAAYPSQKRLIQQQRAARRTQIHQAGMAARHGQQVFADFAEMWERQDGCCYLCLAKLDPGRTVIDHDHRHCPAESSCRLCRRGLTCNSCNTLIGLAKDDPDRLRVIAGNLEIALKAADARLAGKPVQVTLDDC